MEITALIISILALIISIAAYTKTPSKKEVNKNSEILRNSSK